MKTAIISVPMMPPRRIEKINYPVEGDKSIEYGKPVCCPLNGVLAQTMKKGEPVKVIYLITTGKNSMCQKIKENFIEELEGINEEIGAVLEYDTVEMEFLASKHTHNKLITDLAEKIPDNAEIYADITYGFKTETLAFICALRFVEEFRNADIKYLVYGKLETNPFTSKRENPMLFDVTSLYYLFSLIGSIAPADADSALNSLKKFFAL